jgi:hypothetical protein
MCFYFFLKIRACVLAVVVFCVHGLMWQVQGDSAIASFDPYIILNVDRGATDKQIKKAYKLKVRDAHSKRAVAVCCFGVGGRRRHPSWAAARSLWSRHPRLPFLV